MSLLTTQSAARRVTRSADFGKVAVSFPVGYVEVFTW